MLNLERIAMSCGNTHLHLRKTVSEDVPFRVDVFHTIEFQAYLICVCVCAAKQSDGI